MRRLLTAVAAAAALAAAGALPAPAVALPQVKHVFVIVLENQNEATSFGSGSPDPYLATVLRRQGELLPNYYGIGHESNDNYLAMVSGQGPNADTQADCQIYSDFEPGTIGANGQALGTGCVYPAQVKTVADQLTAKGLLWKGYMEDMGNSATEPQTCRHPAQNMPDSTQKARVGDQYATRHNPFVYFHSIVDSPSCTANDVPLDRLPGDLRSASTTAAYSFITPNLCHDGHDSPCVDGEPGSYASADQFLRSWAPRILTSPAYADGGLLIVTFDEAGGSDSSSCCAEPVGPNTPNNGGPVPGTGGGKVGALVLSPYVQPDSTDPTPYNHYGLLRSVEDLFGLDHLGYAGMPGLQAFGADVFNRPEGPVSGGGGSTPGPRPIGPDRIRIRVAGLPRGCVVRDFTVTVSASGRFPVSRLQVAVDRHHLATDRGRPLRLRIHARRLKGGSHRLGVYAVDRRGRGAAASVRFRRCATSSSGR